MSDPKPLEVQLNTAMAQMKGAVEQILSHADSLKSNGDLDGAKEILQGALDIALENASSLLTETLSFHITPIGRELTELDWTMMISEVFSQAKNHTPKNYHEPPSL